MRIIALEQRLAAIPPGIGIVDYLQFDGKPKETDTPDRISLATLRDRYLETHEQSLEPTTVEGIRLHFRHIVGLLGSTFPIAVVFDGRPSLEVSHRLYKSRLFNGPS